MGHPEGLLFVAVAVAWAIYLIPKAIEHHHAANSSRTVDRFSHTLRVLARREPVNRRKAQLVVTGRPQPGATAGDASTAGEPATEGAVATDPAPGPSPAEVRARREASRRAARRRRRVLGLLLLGVAAVAGVAAFRVIDWWYVAIPGGLVLSWLVLSRLMVKRERRAWLRRLHPELVAVAAADEDDAASAEADPDEPTVSIDKTAVAAAMREPGMWDPVPMTLPTYVSKPAAERTVHTIDLGSSSTSTVAPSAGAETPAKDRVWTSGRTEADAALAREADAARDAEKAERADADQAADGRATGTA